MDNKRKIIWAAAGLLVFMLLTIGVVREITLPFDVALRQEIFSRRSPVWTPIFIFITYLGNWQTITAICFALIIRKTYRQPVGIAVSITAGASTLIYKLLKEIIQRPRPELEYHLIQQGGWGFPSGHSMNGLVFYGILLYFIRQKVIRDRHKDALSLGIVLLIFLIGFSRIYLGLHNPTDVLAGWSMGITCLMVAILFMENTGQIKG